MNELWRNIDGYKAMYQVSSLGRVRSFKYIESRVLKQRMNERGYYYLNLCVDGKCKSFTVHRLVSKAFLGKSNLTVNHKNGNKLNNTVENLEWITREDNYQHAKDNNLLAVGSKNGSSKLSKRDIKLIKYKRSKGKSIRCISKEFGVSHSSIIKQLNK